MAALFFFNFCCLLAIELSDASPRVIGYIEPAAIVFLPQRGPSRLFSVSFVLDFQYNRQSTDLVFSGRVCV